MHKLSTYDKIALEFLRLPNIANHVFMTSNQDPNSGKR